MSVGLSGEDIGAIWLTVRLASTVTVLLLLLNSKEQREWRAWTAVAGIDNLPLDHGQVFDTDDAAFQAAAAGLPVR